MFVSDFREVTCDFAFSLPPLRPSSACRKKFIFLAGTKEAACSHLEQDNQMRRIIRFEYHKKIIFNIIANETTKQQQKQNTKKIILKKNHILRSTAHSKKYQRNETFSFLFFLLFCVFFVSLVEIYNQANARNKSGVMYKSHLNARLKQDILFAVSFIKH